MKKVYDSLPFELKKKFSKIKLILLDFDGVLTNNLVIQDQYGKESIIRSKTDSLAIDLLENVGAYNKRKFLDMNHYLDILIISKESNSVVSSVANKLKIKHVSAVHEKSKIFKDEIKKRGLNISETAFIGNDLNDLACVKMAGLGIAVNDSVEEILKVADYITDSPGGRGAFREVCELILYSKNWGGSHTVIPKKREFSID